MRTTSFLAGALCGSLVGAVAAILLAPMPGKKLREQASSAMDNLFSEAKRASSIKQSELTAEVDTLGTSRDEY